MSDYIQDYLAKELVLHAKAKLCMQVLARNMVAWMARQWAAWALNKIMLWTPAPVTLVGDEHGLLRAVQAVYVYVFDVKTKQIEIRPAAQKDSDV